MAFKFLVFCFVCQVVNSQYYSVSSNYPPNYPTYTYNYYSQSSPFAPTQAVPTYPTYQKVVKPKSPKRSIPTTSCPKCSQPTATAYFLSAPTETIKATVLPQEKVKDLKRQTEKLVIPPTYSCALCNNFADVPLNSKVPPPPPVGSAVLPGIFDEIPTIVIPQNLTIEAPKDDEDLIKMKPIFTDMYEKHKTPRNLTFDQELLEGFLTGLGIAS